MDKLRGYFPELSRSSVLRSYLKIAINAVSDNRARRNIGVSTIRPGATMTVLPKWTMCVLNAGKEVALALDHSVSRGNIEPDEVPELLRKATQPCWSETPEWAADPDSTAKQTVKHAVNMGIPEIVATTFA